MYCSPFASTGTVCAPSLSSCSRAAESFKTSRLTNSMPFFERNSFVLRQLLQPGWVNRTNASLVVSIVASLPERLNCAEPINRNSECQLSTRPSSSASGGGRGGGVICVCRLQLEDSFKSFLALPSRIACFSASEQRSASTLSTHCRSPRI
jgi:hypothetical protein